MSIRTNTNGRPVALPATLQDILQRNGMHAQIVEDGGQFALVVQGHDSPVLRYSLTRQQQQALTDYGTNHANRKAYNTFVSIVSKDFDVPRNFVHARNANGRVAMGLHGYRIGVGEYGRTGYERGQRYPYGWMAMDRGGFHHPFLGWTPRQQMGYHMRQIGGEAYFAGAPMTPVRPDGRMKPGELSTGGYGFYYRGGQQNAAQQGLTQGQQKTVDPLAELQTILPHVNVIDRKPSDTAIPYKESITSPVYFTNEKWQEVLASHGLVIDADKKSLTVQSAGSPADLQYDLTAAEVENLTNNFVKAVPIKDRLDIINGVIGLDFKDKVTMDTLNSKQTLNIALQPDALAEVKKSLGIVEPQLQQLEKDNVQVAQQNLQKVQEEQSQGVIDHSANPEEELPPLAEGASVHGEDLQYEDAGKGWYREGAHGREVSVGEIRVEPIHPVVLNETDKADLEAKGIKVKEPDTEVKYKMTAVINGEVISHEISQKQYNKFLALDDEHRMKLFAKVFPEVDIKRIPREDRMPVEGEERGQRVPFGQKLLAALSVAGEATHILRGVAHDVGHIRHDISGQGAERYVAGYSESPHGRGGVYYKPGVDTYNEVASRAFEAGMNAEHVHHELRHGM